MSEDELSGDSDGDRPAGLSYPTYPLKPQSPKSASRTPPPPTVIRAANVSLLALALSLVLTIVEQILSGNTALTIHSTASGTIQTGPNTYQNFTTSISGPGPLAITIPAVLIVTVLWLLLIFLMRRGANWARILLLIFGALGIVGELLEMFDVVALTGNQVAGGLQIGVGLVVVALVVTAMVLMLRPAAKSYFNPRKF